MRSDLVPHVAAALERCARPTLAFDLARIDANLREVAAAARAHGIVALFAAKSFPHAAVRALAARHLAGFDAASAGEIEELRAHEGAILSVADPSGRASAASWRGRLIVSCETIDQIRAAPAHAEIALRISASLGDRDPALGAVLAGTGHRRSRFGLDASQLAACVRAAGGRPLGLHVHHGPLSAASGARFADTARAVLAAAGFEPRFLDLGGAWHAVDDIARAFAEVRAAVPPSIELLVEPGRLFAREAGFAAGHVVVVREVGDRPLVVCDLSRVCHLRWSQPELVAAAPHPGLGRASTWVGPTCYEEDVLGEWAIDPATLPDRFALRNITGYALAWNTGFGGIAPADVLMI